jgi:putative transposase
MHILFRGQGECRIEQRLQNGNLQIRNIVTNQFISITEEEFIVALFDGALELLSDGQGTTLAERRSAKRIASEFSLLQEKAKQEIKRRFTYISAIKQRGLKKLTKETLIPLIEEVKKSITDISPPSQITLYRWWRRYSEAGEDLMMLAPFYKKRGNTKRKFAPNDQQKSYEVAKIINEVIDEKYLSRGRPTVKTTHDAVLSRIISINDFREVEDHLPLPHRGSIHNIVNKLDPYEKTKARYGKRLAKQMYDAVKQGPRPTRPLERVEIDHTKMDMLIIDPVMRLPVGRPWLSIALDVYTKLILGWYISFNPPSYLSVMQCLRHAIAPKTYIKKQYPNIVNAWDAYGLPELIVVDNGPEFHSTHFEDACLQLGINIHYAPPKQGKYKGSIERWFRTHNQQLLHSQPGTTFSNILDRADYDPKANAVITIEALKEMCHIYICDIYHQQKHRGIRDIPARLWKEAIAEYPPALPPHHTCLDVLLGCVTQRVISSKGIELHGGGLFYNDDSLALLRRRLRAGQQVRLKYDPTNLSMIHVADIERGLYLPVPAVNQEYAEGLSLWQHNIINLYARLRIKRNVDIVALARAKQKIQDIVECEWLTTKKTNTRQRLARAIQYGEQGQLQLRDQVTSQDRATLLIGNNKISQLEARSAMAGISNLDDTPCKYNETNLGNDEDELRVSVQNGPGVNDDELNMDGWEADYDLPK